MGTTTPNLGLYKPVLHEGGYDDELNASLDIIDSRISELVFNIRSFGADPTASDNATAINAALAAAATATGSGATGYTGGRVFVPKGAYKVKSQIVIPNFVTMVGVGNRASKIVADTGFPTAADDGTGNAARALIRLGPGSSPVFDCGIENLRVECNSIAATGVYTGAANESSGVKHCVVNNAITDGIYFTSGASLATIADSEVANLAGGNSGISIVGVAGPIVLLGEITINHAPTGAQNTYGLYTSSAISMNGTLHCEHCVTGVHFNSGGGGWISHYIGHSSNTREIQIGASMSSGIVVIGRIQASAATTINDLAHSTTITGETGLYQWSSASGNGKLAVP